MTEGKCPDACTCTLEHNPVCCPQFEEPQEYGNPCAADCDLEAADLIKCHYGECDEEPDPMCMCPLIHEPVCCGGEDYSSGCM